MYCMYFITNTVANFSQWMFLFYFQDILAGIARPNEGGFDLVSLYDAEVYIEGKIEAQEIRDVNISYGFVVQGIGKVLFFSIRKFRSKCQNCFYMYIHNETRSS